MARLVFSVLPISELLRGHDGNTCPFSPLLDANHCSLPYLSSIDLWETHFVGLIIGAYINTW